MTHSEVIDLNIYIWTYPPYSISQAKNAVDRGIFEDMREFAVLQRLFRVALEGGLGQYFPIDKLPVLAEQTAGSVKYHRTLRWNARSGSL